MPSEIGLVFFIVVNEKSPRAAAEGRVSRINEMPLSNLKVGEPGQVYTSTGWRYPSTSSMESAYPRQNLEDKIARLEGKLLMWRLAAIGIAVILVGVLIAIATSPALQKI